MIIKRFFKVNTVPVATKNSFNFSMKNLGLIVPVPETFYINLHTRDGARPKKLRLWLN
jgi:hypothetical protein